MSATFAMPWAPQARCYCAPRRLIFTLALGEDVSSLPARSDVRSRRCEAATRTGHGAVDRVLRTFGGNMALARLHDPAQARDGFDLLEHARGLSRTYVATFSDVHRLDQTVDTLRQLCVVVGACVDYIVSEKRLSPVGGDHGRDDPRWPWRMVGADRTRTMEAGHPSVTTAVLDTGAATRHAELSGRLSTGFDAVNFSSSDLAAGLSLIGDFGTRDTDPTEAHNPHGTACLAIIGGHGREMPAGLSPASTLMPVRVLASARAPGRGTQGAVVGLGALSDIDYAMKRAVDLGAKVLNCSFGTSEDVLMPGDPIPHSETVSYALDRGAVLVAASGNSGKPERYHPAASDGVVAVGSVGPARHPSHFSATGDHVALLAPGENILTPSIDGYEFSTGTSFGAPFVAGAAALMVARARRAARPLDSAQVRRLLMASATPLQDPSLPGHGAGILNIPAALAMLDSDIATATSLGVPAAKRSPS